MNTNRSQSEKRFALQSPRKHPFISESTPDISMNMGFDVIWKLHSLKIFCAVTKFILKLKTAAERYRFKTVTLRIHDIIGDQSSCYDYFSDKNLVFQKITVTQQVIKFFSNLLPQYQIGVIKPDSHFKLLLDCCILALIIVNILYIPMDLSFQFENVGFGINFICSTLPSYIFVLEIVLNFNTAYYSEGMIHESRKMIFKHYVKGDFLKDLLVVIPFFISQYNIPYINYVLLLRVTRVNKMVQQIEEITLIREKFAAPLDIVKLMFFMVLVSHIFGCAWHYVGQYQLAYSQDCWLVKYNLDQKDWSTRYVASLYVATITAFTVGYGDIVPQTPIEQLFMTFMVLVTSLIFGYTISSIQTIFGQLREKTDLHRNNMAKVNSYMKKHKLNPVLQMKVKKYLDYFIDVEDSPEQLLDKLNDDLKLELKSNIYMQVMKTCSLFSRFSEQTLKQLTKAIKSQTYIPGSVIFQQGEFIQNAYFIVKGVVESSVNSMAIATQYKGSIGTKEFLDQSKAHFNTKAVQFTEVAYITKQDFLSILKQDQNSYEQYCNLRDDILFSVIPIQCMICRRSHDLMNCPVVFYKPLQTKVSQDKSSNYVLERFPQKRRKYIKWNTLQKQQDNIECALEVAMDNGVLHDEVNEDFLCRIGYKEKKQIMNRSQCSQQKQNLDQLKVPKLKRVFLSSEFNLSEYVQNDGEKQLEQIYKEFLLFKKEDLEGIDKTAELQSYRKRDNLSSIILCLKGNKYKPENSRVSRMKTYKFKSFLKFNNK